MFVAQQDNLFAEMKRAIERKKERNVKTSVDMYIKEKNTEQSIWLALALFAGRRSHSIHLLFSHTIHHQR